MRNLILYGTKYGSTAECATKLAALLVGQTDVKNVEQRDIIDPSAYDRIILGSSVYMGQIHKGIRKFTDDHLPALSGGKTAIFICCSLPENFQDILKANFPEQLLVEESITACFGGRLEIDRMKLVDKAIAKLMTKQKGDAAPVPGILYDAIEAFAERLNMAGKEE